MMQGFLVFVHVASMVVWWLLVARILLQFLIAWEIANIDSPVIKRPSQALDKTIEPMLKPIQWVLPLIGGIDFSPIALLLMIGFVGDLAKQYGG